MPPRAFLCSCQLGRAGYGTDHRRRASAAQSRHLCGASPTPLHPAALPKLPVGARGAVAFAPTVMNAQTTGSRRKCAGSLLCKLNDTLLPACAVQMCLQLKTVHIDAQEPSPFSHVSGMKNRFECLIQGLRAAGDDVMVFTPDRNPPRKYFGAKVCRDSTSTSP